MSGMSKIVKTVSNITFPLIVIYGLYVIAHGHLTPGGGFQGGAVVASGLAMILVAYGSVWTMGKIKEKRLSVFESVGAGDCVADARRCDEDELLDKISLAYQKKDSIRENLQATVPNAQSRILNIFDIIEL